MEKIETTLLQEREIHNKCAFCGEREGEFPLYDGETLRELHICKDCNWLLCMVESTQDTEDF